MTIDAQIREFQDHARRSLQGEQPDQALALLQQANSLAPNSATTLMLTGVALSNMRQSVQASETFVHALALEPENPKILYNYAVHLYGCGRLPEARQVVERALEISPEHPASNQLARQLGVAAPLAGPAASAMAPTLPRLGYEVESGIHIIPFLGRISLAWKILGWCLAFSSLVSLVLLVSILFQVGGGSDFVGSFSTAGSFAAFRDFYWISLLGAIFYGAIDMTDRRENPAWLIPLVIGPLICLGWIGLPLYLLSTKK